MTLVMDGMTFKGTVDEIASIVDRLAPRTKVQVTIPCGQDARGGVPGRSYGHDRQTGRGSPDLAGQ